MKKTLLSLAILLASSTGISAFAQAPAQNAKSATTTEAKARKGERKQAPNPFEGLNLTDQQKSQLKDLKPGITKEKREEMKAQDKARKEQAKAQAAEQRKARAEARKQSRHDYLAKVKAILTPEQYVQFLENNFVNKADMKKAPRKVKTKKGKAHRNAAKKGPKAKGSRPEGKQPKADDKK